MTDKRITEIAKRQVSQMCSVHPAEIQELIEDGIKEALQEQLTPVVSKSVCRCTIPLSKPERDNNRCFDCGLPIK